MRNAATALNGFYAHALGLLKVTGVDRIDLLHRLSTQDLRPLYSMGHFADTVFTTAQGRCVAWARVVADESCLWICCAATRATALAAWIDRYTIMEDVQVEDLSHLYCGVQIFGKACLQTLDLTRALEMETAVFQTSSGSIWTRALEAWGPSVVGWSPRTMMAQFEGITALDADTWQIQRLYAGIPDDAFELKGEINPLEMRLGASSISWKKGCYIGQEVISRLDSYDKVARLLMGFQIEMQHAQKIDRTVDVSTLRLLDEGKPVGRVTSWQRTPEGIVGLAVVKRRVAEAKAIVLKTPSADYPVQLHMRAFWA